MASSRVLLNPHANPSYRSPAPDPEINRLRVHNLHHSLPTYNVTPLHSLPSLAEELGLGHVFLKDESSRFGLPSFKILGASFAVYMAVCDKVGLHAPDPKLGLEELARIVSGDKSIKVVTCTEGNWGRAVGWVTRQLGIAAKVFVSSDMIESTRALIRGEGAELVDVEGNYEDCAVATKRDADETGALLVMDMGWEGYEQIPQWVVDGYWTMLQETQEILLSTLGKEPTHAFVPVGVGSIAQAVTQHFKSAYTTGRVLSVEPTTAASLFTALKHNAITSVPTGDTIMCGMNCGTVSTTAWPVLQAGVDAAVQVDDQEAHASVQELAGLGIFAGPCGAATLAGLRCVMADDAARESLGLGKESIVVLYSTEGKREYPAPA